MSGTRLAVLGVALAFLVGAVGYFVGVRTTEPRCNDVDVGFLRDMTSHHDQAVELALIELARGTDPNTRRAATEVLLFQRQELGRFQNFGDDCGAVPPEYSLDRQTMEWMGMPTPLRTMPGMASEAEIEHLRSLSGAEADVEFLRLLQVHHRGGAHMADYQAEHGSVPALRDLARTMARYQLMEANEYQGMIDAIRARAGS
jgi:uncharacterized protein (DUF305 family)